MAKGLTLEKIERQHKELVKLAKENGISISSEQAWGIV